MSSGQFNGTSNSNWRQLLVVNYERKRGLTCPTRHGTLKTRIKTWTRYLSPRMNTRARAGERGGGGGGLVQKETKSRPCERGHLTLAEVTRAHVRLKKKGRRNKKRKDKKDNVDELKQFISNDPCPLSDGIRFLPNRQNTKRADVINASHE